MFDKPIFIYSDYCVYSTNFLKTLMKYPDLYNSFIRMNIDVIPESRQRPKAFYQMQDALGVKITKVPTVITPNAQYILSDVDAFKWLEHQVKLLTDTSEDLQPFNPTEMTSFSDNYANFGSTDLCDAKSQSFRFLQSDGGTSKLTGDNYLNTSKTWDPRESGKTNGFLNDLETTTSDVNLDNKQSERDFFDKMRNNNTNTNNSQIDMKDQYVQNTNNSSKVNTQQRHDVPRQRMNGNINFTDANFGMSGQLSKNGGSGKSNKENEIDTKLQQLMKDREGVNIELTNRVRDF